MSRVRAFAQSLIMLALATSAWGQTGANPAPTTGASLLQSLWGLAIVLAVIAGLAWIVKRSTGARTGPTALLKPIAALPVGAKERVVLIELGDQWILLGVAAGQVNALHTTPKRADLMAPNASAAGGFRDKLASMRSNNASR